jgi:hypothetical protein
MKTVRVEVPFERTNVDRSPVMGRAIRVMRNEMGEFRKGA